jgi:hypothetical protein
MKRERRVMVKSLHDPDSLVDRSFPPSYVDGKPKPVMRGAIHLYSSVLLIMALVVMGYRSSPPSLLFTILGK